MRWILKNSVLLLSLVFFCSCSFITSRAILKSLELFFENFVNLIYPTPLSLIPKYGKCLTLIWARVKSILSLALEEGLYK